MELFLYLYLIFSYISNKYIFENKYLFFHFRIRKVLFLIFFLRVKIFYLFSLRSICISVLWFSNYEFVWTMLTSFIIYFFCWSGKTHLITLMFSSFNNSLPSSESSWLCCENDCRRTEAKIEFTSHKEFALDSIPSSHRPHDEKPLEKERRWRWKVRRRGKSSLHSAANFQTPLTWQMTESPRETNDRSGKQLKAGSHKEKNTCRTYLVQKYKSCS